MISSIFFDHNGMKLEIDLKETLKKHTNTGRLNNTLLNNERVDNEIKEEITRHLGINESENTTTQSLWDSAKAVLRWIFIGLQAYLRK